MQLKFRQGIISLSIVVLEAYVVAAFYLLSRIDWTRSPIKVLSVFNPIPENARFDLWGIEYFPWTDMGENVLHAFYVAHGMKFGVDAVVAHLPGVPLYLAAFMWSLGFWNAVPSAQTAFAAYSLSAFAVALFQIGCMVAAFSLFSAPRLGLLVAPLLVFFAADAFDMVMPMSENLIAYWLIFMFTMLCRMMVFDQPVIRSPKQS